jgi:chromosomal replication initiator protein
MESPGFGGDSPGGCGNGVSGEEGEMVQRLYAKIQDQLGVQQFTTWFHDTTCVFVEPQTFVFTAANNFRRAWMQNEFGEIILAAARSICSSEPRLQFKIEASSDSAQQLTAAAGSPGLADENGAGPPGRPTVKHRLNRDLTFENFIVGPGSRVAYAAALAISELPGKTYNPLYIHGEPGTGKTHLLQAISHRLAATSNLTQIYVTAESFTNEYIRAVEIRELDPFRARYRGTDVLLVDDVQFLSAKAKTQEEFFHTFCALLAENRQIVLASNCHPQDIKQFNENLSSRFRWGLLAQLSPPAFETRVSALLHKAQLRGQKLELEAAKHLVRHVVANLHELEGALTRLISLATLHRSALNLEMAHLTLREILDEEKPSAGAITVDSILTVLQEYYGVKAKELLSSSKMRSLSYPRQIGMYLARELTPLSLEQIGLRFGGRDHTTVLYAQKRIDKLLKRSVQTRTDLQVLKSRITASHSR